MSLHQTLKGGFGFLATEGLFRLASFSTDPPLGEREKIKSRLEPSNDPDYRPLCEEHSQRRGFLKSAMKGEIGNITALVTQRQANFWGRERHACCWRPWKTLILGCRQAVSGRTSFIKRASMQNAARCPGGKNAILTSLPSHLRVPLITT